MAGAFGYELDISKLTAEEKEEVRSQVEAFKKHHALIREGDYYRLTNPFQNSRYAAWQFVSPDRAHALLCYVLIHAQASAPVVYLYPRGLLPEARYTFELGGESQLLTGAALMQGGLPMPRIRGDYRALTVELEQVL